LAGWEGRSAPLTAPAQELLQPNAVFSTRFVNPSTGKHFSVSLIHCRYAKNMNYHEPQVCYPNNGWQLGSADPQTWETARGAIDGIEYTFRQVRENRLHQIRVANFFVMPDGKTEARATSVRERIKLPWVDSFGVAQLQFIFDASFSAEERNQLVEAFLDRNWDALQIIQSGIKS